MKTKELNNGVAVEVLDFDICNIDREYAEEIKKLLYKNTIVVLRNQTTKAFQFTKFTNHIGPVADRYLMNRDPHTGKVVSYDKWNMYDPETYLVQRVTAEKVDGEYSGIFSTGILDWHSNLNGPVHADGVALQGIKDCENTSTTWVNTAKALKEMPEDLKKRCKGVYCEYDYAPDVWAKGLPKGQQLNMESKATPYSMWLLQENIAGNNGLYFYTNNRCRMITDDKTLFSDLYDYVFQEKFMYTHVYEVGDIILSDQLLSLHKRDQNDPEILEKRVLHRITFYVSNQENNHWIQQNNIIGDQNGN
jgi:taurine dioxygenase